MPSENPLKNISTTSAQWPGIQAWLRVDRDTGACWTTNWYRSVTGREISGSTDFDPASLSLRSACAKPRKAPLGGTPRTLSLLLARLSGRLALTRRLESLPLSHLGSDLWWGSRLGGPSRLCFLPDRQKGAFSPIPSGVPLVSSELPFMKPRVRPSNGCMQRRILYRGTQCHLTPRSFHILVTKWGPVGLDTR
jgi:hypothetical protein